MSRIQNVLATLKAAGRQALIPYVTAGDPDPAQAVAVMHALAAGGADIIELGVPFSDPMADGPVIQKASERALARGVGLRQVLQWVREFREADPDTPVVLMGYANPIERHELRDGAGSFVAAAAEAGVDGVLVPLTVDEASVAALATPPCAVCWMIFSSGKYNKLELCLLSIRILVVLL